MRIAQVLTVGALSLAMVSTASAERRPGLGGKYAARNMTAAQGSLLIIAGPTTTQLLGGGVGPLGTDGGFGYATRPDIDLGPLGTLEQDPIVTAGIGAAYGITPELEVGLVLPLLLSGGGDGADTLNTAHVFATYAKDMGKFDVGVRVTGNIAIVDGLDNGVTIGIPFLTKVGMNGRLDAGVFVPLNFGEDPATGDSEIGKALNIPIRYGHSITPKIFLGVETGLYLPEIKTDAGRVPFSIFGGYTLLAGGNVVDLGLSFGLPSAIYLGDNGPGATDTIQLQVGTNVQMAF